MPNKSTVETEENRTGLDGKTLQETLAEVTALMDLLGEFNLAIEKANEANRADLVRMDTLKAKISLYEQIATKCRDCKGFDYEYPNGAAVSGESAVKGY